jgi:hypothetical protein
MSRRWLTGCDCRLPSLPHRAADHVPQAAGFPKPPVGACRSAGAATTRYPDARELRRFYATGPTLALIPELGQISASRIFDRRVARCPDTP